MKKKKTVRVGLYEVGLAVFGFGYGVVKWIQLLEAVDHPNTSATTLSLDFHLYYLPLPHIAPAHLFRFPRRSAAAAIAQTVADFSSTNDRASSTKQRKKKRRAEKETKVAPEVATILPRGENHHGMGNRRWILNCWAIFMSNWEQIVGMRVVVVGMGNMALG
ncbi:hypothetical protein MTR67_014474 [Solanum verrucosum]|uniref:Uncharacterized protein n=1 Tax=Solanum verrucosum TaxID=315347 RepID=A0AAF0QCA0_SOLVR|nr:hypothetical protein MTR67_014474 [Solanum verrucosum]